MPLALLLAAASIGRPQAGPENTGTPPDAAGGPSPVVSQSLVLANSGPRVGVLAYCTNLTGNFGAENTVNTLVADGRFGSVTLIDADAAPPTAEQLAQQFDCVIAMTDNKCGSVLSPSQPLADYALGGGGVVLASFGYSTTIGFDAPIFQTGLSPFQPVQGPNAPAGAVDIAGAATTPQACADMMAGVTAPAISTFANYVNLSPGAALCASYMNGRAVLAINANGNVVGFNSFPAALLDNTQAGYRRLLGNAVRQVCGGTLEARIDIKFCSDPNAYNCRKKGVLPVTVFGDANLDVTQIDVYSLKLCVADAGGEPTSDCTGPPRNWSISDRGNPDTDLGADRCAVVDGVEVDYLTRDGLADLDVAFEAQEVTAIIGCAELARKAASPTLVLVGTAGNGATPLQSVPAHDAGIDQLLIQNK